VSRKTKKKEGGAKRAQRASSNVFSMFEQTQIQEFKEAFTLIDQNRDGFIDQEDLKDTYASLGKLNVKDGELEEMLKEASGPINFTMFLNLFGEKTSETFSRDSVESHPVKQMFESSNIDAAGNLDYKSLCYIITHGEEQQDLLQAVYWSLFRGELNSVLSWFYYSCRIGNAIKTKNQTLQDF
uniref:Myosin light chain 5 n=1 Tax=Amphiprion percula TaxID=161767 RepID=A0A3P8U8S3_AMPPE